MAEYPVCVLSYCTEHSCAYMLVPGAGRSVYLALVTFGER